MLVRKGCQHWWLKIAVTSIYLFFWHHDFGHAGALNDLNIWERSSLHKHFLDGTIATIDFDFEIGRQLFKKLFFWLMEYIRNLADL